MPLRPRPRPVPPPPILGPKLYARMGSASHLVMVTMAAETANRPTPPPQPAAAPPHGPFYPLMPEVKVQTNRTHIMIVFRKR